MERLEELIYLSKKVFGKYSKVSLGTSGNCKLLVIGECEWSARDWDSCVQEAIEELEYWEE